MDTKYIIVEGEEDLQLLNAILPSLSERVKVVAAGGYSAVLSKAATVLAYLHQPALLALDTDTTDRRTIAEKQQFVHDYLRSSQNDTQLELVLFSPTLFDYLLDHEQTADRTMRRHERGNRLTQLAFQRRLADNPSTVEHYRNLPHIQAIIKFAQA